MVTAPAAAATFEPGSPLRSDPGYAFDFCGGHLAIDFTNPVFSDARCDLLKFAPALPATLNAKTLRDAFIAKLGAAQTQEASELLASFKTPNDSGAHTAGANKFWNACLARFSSGSPLD